jgi:4-carboxymuconolactone decarboxylase
MDGDAGRRRVIDDEGGPLMTTNDLDAGMQVRKEVLGAAHVDRSMAAATEFGLPLQEFVTEYCWGRIWTRPGLDRKTRSLLNLGVLTALNRMHEFGVHVRGAVTNGCSAEEIQEVILQTAIYCGVPAALESSRTAERVLQELAAEGPVEGSSPR